MATPISPEVRRFVIEHIDSVAQLELLLMLHRDPRVAWTPEQAGREMRCPAPWAATQLERFRVSGWVSVSHGADQHFCYRARGRIGRLIDELAAIYARRKTSVTGLIYTRGSSDLSTFSDAFRIRDHDDG